jgi:hypothetical protein
MIGGNFMDKNKLVKKFELEYKMGKTEVEYNKIWKKYNSDELVYILENSKLIQSYDYYKKELITQYILRYINDKDKMAKIRKCSSYSTLTSNMRSLIENATVSRQKFLSNKHIKKGDN